MAREITIDLLERWYQGDRQALDELLARNLDWMRRRVRRDLSPALRRECDSVDVVQDAAVRLLTYGPKFAPESEAQFRALLARVLVTVLRDRIEAQRALRRGGGRVEEALPDEGLSRFEAMAASITAPDAAAERSELEQWIRVGLEFLEPDDRRVIVLRQFDGKSFDEIAVEMSLTGPDAARMRFNRALPRLARRVAEIRTAVENR